MKQTIAFLISISIVFTNCWAMHGGQNTINFNGTLNWGGSIQPSLNFTPALPAQTTPPTSTTPAAAQAIQESQNKTDEIAQLIQSLESKELTDTQRKSKIELAQKLHAEREKINKELVDAAIRQLQP